MIVTDSKGIKPRGLLQAGVMARLVAHFRWVELIENMVELANIDLWAATSYRGHSFGALFTDFAQVQAIVISNNSDWRALFTDFAQVQAIVISNYSNWRALFTD